MGDDQTAAERARRLLDAYPEDLFPPPPQDWTPGMVTGQVPDSTDEDGYEDVWITADRFAAHALRKIALPAIADLLAVVPVSSRPDQRLLDVIGDPQWLRDGARGDFEEGWADYLRRIADAVEAVLSDTQTDPEPMHPDCNCPRHTMGGGAVPASHALDCPVRIRWASEQDTQTDPERDERRCPKCHSGRRNVPRPLCWNRPDPWHSRGPEQRRS